MIELELESVGKLSPHPDDPDDWLISGEVSIPFFNGKKLKFILVLDNENDEHFFADADKAINNFLKKDKKERNDIFFFSIQKLF